MHVPAILAAPELLDFELSGATLRFRQTTSERREHGLTWRGTLPGHPEFQATITVHQHVAMGLLTTPAGIFELTTDEHGRQVVLRLDDQRFPACGGERRPTLDEWPPPTAETTTQGGVLPADSAFETDVMIVLTAPVVAALGGPNQARAFAQSAVDSANSTFANSQIRTRFRLVSVQETAQPEAGTTGANLSFARNDPQIASWRSRSGADVVALMVETPTDSCGMGYVMTAPGQSFAPNAFQVTVRSCAIGNLSYVHEHGHHLGLTHNPEDGSSGSYPYAFGHWINGKFRTVMSYATPCSGGCTRLPYFSNPNVAIGDEPTGVADQRDNARAANQNGDIVANFQNAAAAAILFANGFD